MKGMDTVIPVIGFRMTVARPPFSWLDSAPIAVMAVLVAHLLAPITASASGLGATALPLLIVILLFWVFHPVPAEPGRPVAEPPAVDNARLVAILDHTVLRYDVDPESRIVSANVLMCDRSGFSTEELIGADISILRMDLPRPWLELRDEIRDGGIWQGEASFVAKDGSEIWMSSTIAAITAPDRSVCGYSCVGIDVTERRKARDELLRNSKLMQLGQLTATVAHEIRNPLGAIRTASFVLERKVRGQLDGVGPQLERINNGIQRCDKIITELLDVSRAKTLKTRRLPVDAWIEETIEEERKALAGSPVIVLNLRLGAIEAQFDPDQLRQVVINLLANAAEAMSEKVKADELQRYVPTIHVTTRLAGPFVEIIFTDNGPGIEPKHMKRIREPLFTTKSFGCGLGLPAIERILDNHGGYLGIESVVGQGATIVAGFRQYRIDNAAA